MRIVVAAVVLSPIAFRPLVKYLIAVLEIIVFFLKGDSYLNLIGIIFRIKTGYVIFVRRDIGYEFVLVGIGFPFVRLVTRVSSVIFHVS